MSDEMPDSTRELLNVHHVAILRELDGLGRDLRSDLHSLKTDLTNTRNWQDGHTREDNTRFSSIDGSLRELKIAYGLGIFVMVALLAYLKVMG